MLHSSDRPLLRIANAAVEVEVDVELGAEIRSVRRPGGANVLASYDWTTPISNRRGWGQVGSEVDWLSDYSGGWQELFPNAGGSAEVDGVRLPFHGEASRARWEVVKQAADGVTLRTGARLPLVLERTMRLTENPPALRIEEVVRSDAPVATAFLLGHHPAFLATEGARIDMPGTTMARVDADFVTDLVDLEPGATAAWPSLPGRTGGSIDLDIVPAGPVERLAYLSGMGDAPWAAIRGVEPGLGTAISWDGATYPYVWNWWEIGGTDYPWFGRARIVAIEPAMTNVATGLADARRLGHVVELGAGEEHRSWVTVSLFDADERPVTGVRQDGLVER
jgi:galactose mutarotase-like enzyme